MKRIPYDESATSGASAASTSTAAAAAAAAPAEAVPVPSTDSSADPPAVAEPTGAESSASSASSSASADASSSSTPSDLGYVWEWQDGAEEWQHFDKMACRLLEGMCKRGLKSTTLNHGEYAKSAGGYAVDFASLNRRENATGRLDPIRRNPPPVDLSMSVYGSGSALAESELANETGADDGGFEEKSSVDVAKAEKLTRWAVVKRQEFAEDDSCVICLSELNDPDETDEEAEVVVRLSRCAGHAFHRNCIVQCVTDGFLQCPVCARIYGVRVGQMPEGKMRVSRSQSKQCAGYEEFGTIKIVYSFPDGNHSPLPPFHSPSVRFCVR
jgi:WWE domain/Deltex C-terminal domain/Zinc finger, C3HC4 type (RING finger)